MPPVTPVILGAGICAGPPKASEKGSRGRPPAPGRRRRPDPHGRLPAGKGLRCSTNISRPAWKTGCPPAARSLCPGTDLPQALEEAERNWAEFLDREAEIKGVRLPAAAFFVRRPRCRPCSRASTEPILRNSRTGVPENKNSADATAAACRKSPTTPSRIFFPGRKHRNAPRSIQP